MLRFSRRSEPRAPPSWHSWTEKRRSRSRRTPADSKLDAVSGVLPPSDNDVASDALVLNDGTRDVVFYRGRKGGTVVGAAFGVTAPNGYSGSIEMLVGVDTAGVVTGLEI